MQTYMTAAGKSSQSKARVFNGQSTERERERERVRKRKRGWEREGEGEKA
jgi:hypothetical protein